MPRIPDETVEQIASANDIVEVISGYFPLKRAGSAFKALCPFHSEKTPSFTVNPQRQTFHCFGCGAGGSVFRFVMLYENLEFPAAVKRLAERVGIRIVEEALSPEDARKVSMRRRLLALHAEAADWFHHLLLKTAAGKPARDYLRRRGLNSQIAEAWKIGFAPNSFEAFTAWALGSGYGEREIAESGLVKLRNEEDPAGGFYDRFRNRVMFAICNDYGEVIGFSGRTLESDPKAAKYLNSPETMLFHKGKILFGLHKAKRALIEKNSAIVCEGQLDLITAFESGIENVIAPQGTAFTGQQARILKRYVEEVVLCFDADTAGQKAAERSLPALLDNSLFVRVAEMPEGHDPDSLIRERGSDAFRRQIDSARDFFDAMIDRNASGPDFATPRGKLQFARKMAESISLISDVVMRDAVINKMSGRLELSPDDLRKLLREPRRTRGEGEDQARVELLPSLTPTIRLLCLLALRHCGANQWMREQPWDDVLAEDPESGFLQMLLRSEFEPENDHSIGRLAATLSANEESLISALLLDPLPEKPETVLADCWAEIQRRGIRRRQTAIAAKLRQTDLSMDEIVALQKETLDLQQRLNDIARPLPATL